MQTIEAALSAIKVGDPQQVQNLVMFPLFLERDCEPGYLTLDEAVRSGKCRITEVSQGGSVPELAFENLSPDPILLLDGEELVGAKQNRVLNLTILVGGALKLNIPVSCVEQGRWSYRTHEFSSGGRTMFSRGRAAKMSQVNQSMGTYGTRHSDQGAVWEDIHGKARRLDAMSDTMAAEAVYARAKNRTAEFVAGLRWHPGQHGAVFAINGELVGSELFDCSATLSKVMPKLVESYALDAIDVDEVRSTMPPKEIVQAFLEHIRTVPGRSFRAVGEGEDIRLENTELVGAALAAADRVIHLSAFPQRSAGRPRQRYARTR
jgi:hypothetical protein